jgi:hypothetical protein
MYSITRPAARDYNENIRAIQEAALANNLDTIISVVKCGVGPQARVDREITNSNIHVVQPIMEHAYIADGSGTPLFDSIGDLIETLSGVPDAADPEVSFLIMAITDGEENASRRWPAKRLGEKIRELQASDRWSFVFRVPKNYGATLTRFGIPEGNILEWEQTARGVAVASAATASAVSSYFVNRSQGIKSTNKFYADLSKVSVNEVKQSLNDISKQVIRYYVPKSDDGAVIKAFVERYTPSYQIGTVFYQLSKIETVQEAKLICIRDRNSGAIYSGVSARDLLGLPHHGAIRLAPHNLANYDVFVQSTSVNRKLVGDTTVLYCPMFAR